MPVRQWERQHIIRVEFCRPGVTLEPMSRRSFGGDFRISEMAHGLRLSGAMGNGANLQLWVLGLDVAAAEFPRGCQHIEVEWGRRVTLRVGSAYYHACSVHVHEPQRHLYEVLPLARSEAKIQRFWQRLFTLVKLPGGRRLLAMWARRTARKA